VIRRTCRDGERPLKIDALRGVEQGTCEGFLAVLKREVNWNPVILNQLPMAAVRGRAESRLRARTDAIDPEPTFKRLCLFLSLRQLLKLDVCGPDDWRPPSNFALHQRGESVLAALLFARSVEA
jgi:hypothetical protein